MGLSLSKFVQWAPKDASFLQQSAYWPFNVVQDHPRSIILVPIESVYTTSFIVTMVLSCTISEIRRLTVLAKNCLFLLPLSHSAPPLPMFPLEFCGEVNHEETRVIGLSSSEDRMIVAGVVLTQCQCVTDGWTDRLIYYS